MLTNCFRFAPRDSVPGLIAKICKYLKDHPGWSEEELEEQIRLLIGQTGVESFNGRTGAVVLNEKDVNDLKIASAYFAEGDETIDEIDVATLYNQGVRFVFTNWNSVTSGYDLAFVLEYFSGSDDVVYYPMATGSGGGNIVSVNGKTGIVELSLSDIIGDSGAQVKLCTATEFTSTTLNTWNTYYEEGYRVVGVVNSDASAIDYIYLLKQDENNHQPIGLSAGASDAYTPNNPPPYPVTSVNGATGAVKTVERYDNGKNYYSSTTPYIGIFNNGIIYGVDSNNEAHYTYSDANKPPYPVTSVNGKTGAVTGMYGTENPPPYPVTSVNGMLGNVRGFVGQSSFPIYPGSIMRDVLVILGANLEGTLAPGRTAILHFRQSSPYAAISSVFFSNRSSLGVSATIVRENDIYVYVTNMDQEGMTANMSDLNNSLGLINFSGGEYSLEYVDD